MVPIRDKSKYFPIRQPSNLKTPETIITEILATYLYKKAFGSIQLGYGSAVAVVIIIIAVFGVNIIKRLTNEETF